MLINCAKDSAKSWCKQGDNKKLKILREQGLETGARRRAREFGRERGKVCRRTSWRLAFSASFSSVISSVSSTCWNTCLGTCSEPDFFWMECLPLMAQYPRPSRVTVWKPPYKKKLILPQSIQGKRAGGRSWSRNRVKGCLGPLFWSCITTLSHRETTFNQCTMSNFIIDLKTNFLVQRSLKFTKIDTSYFPLSQRSRLNKICLLYTSPSPRD